MFPRQDNRFSLPALKLRDNHTMKKDIIVGVLTAIIIALILNAVPWNRVTNIIVVFFKSPPQSSFELVLATNEDNEEGRIYKIQNMSAEKSIYVKIPRELKDFNIVSTESPRNASDPTSPANIFPVLEIKKWDNHTIVINYLFAGTGFARKHIVINYTYTE
jgi:hypothetical protein